MERKPAGRVQPVTPKDDPISEWGSEGCDEKGVDLELNPSQEKVQKEEDGPSPKPVGEEGEGENSKTSAEMITSEDSPSDHFESAGYEELYALTQITLFVKMVLNSWTEDPWVMDLQRVLNKKMHPVLQFVLCYTVTMILGIALGMLGVGFEWLYTQADWFGDGRSKVVILLIMGSIFTPWNIAQYASFTIQTTGHFEIIQHIRSMARIGPFLLASNSLGWLLAVFCAFAIPDAPVFWHACLIIVPSVLMGIVTKTYCKLKYLLQRSQCGVRTTDADVFGRKMRRGGSYGISMTCPFSAVSCKLMLVQVSQPVTCFLWTVLYSVGVKYMLLGSKNLPGGIEGWQQNMAFSAIFAGCFLLQEGGEHLLNKSIASAKGLGSYQQKMTIAFYLIYMATTETLTCLAIVSARGTLRKVLPYVRPLGEFYFRHKEYCEYKRVYPKLHKSYTAAGFNDEYVQLDAQVSRMLMRLMSSLVIASVVPIMTSGAACLFTADTGLDMQSDCDDGFFMTALGDVGPGMALMVVDMGLAQLFYPMTLLHFYIVLFDPFLVLAVLVVIYMLVALVAFTAVV